MKRKLLKCVLLVFILFSPLCYGQNIALNKPKSFKILGIIKGNIKDNYVHLYFNKIEDSVKIIDNTFEFNGVVKDTTTAWIGINSSSNAPLFYIENNNYEMQITVEDIVKNGKPAQKMNIDAIKGSSSFIIQEEYKKFYQANVGKSDFNKTLYSKLKIFLKKHSAHPFSGAILAELALMNPILNQKELNELFILIDSTKQNEQDLKLFKKGIANLDLYGIGKSFPDFNLPDQTGNIISLKNYKGKFILIDFWASWCAPCRKKNPELVDLKHQFASSNFDIIGISIDDNKKSWQGAIIKDKSLWTNVLDANQNFKKTLGIEHIPYNYLLDDKGTIIAVNVEISELRKIVSALKSS
ncbi:redoxin domain-containing protein [Flavobacterium sp. P21]|uniref:redoxin domain-containing protein n=1 Tax=Flavobacterium sp. P21 TaxID=3423948 RepID=UPI003D66A7DD